MSQRLNHPNSVPGKSTKLTHIRIRLKRDGTWPRISNQRNGNERKEEHILGYGTYVTFVKVVGVKSEEVASVELKSKSVTAVIGVISYSQSHIQPCKTL